MSKPSFTRVAAPLAVAAFAGALAVACGGADDDPSFGGTGGPVTGQPGGVVATGGGTPGGTTGVAVPPGPGGGGTTGGTGVTPTPGAAGGGTTGGTAQPGGGGGTAGAGVDTPWCKVKRIVDAKCVACHTTPLAAGAPFPLQTWQDFQGTGKGGKKIYERVGVRVDATKAQADGANGVMPPGNQLPADSLATINSWIAAGAPQGDNPTCSGIPDGAGGSTAGTTPVVEWPPKECDGVYKIVAHGAGGESSPYVVTPKQEVHPQVQWNAPWGSEKVQAIGFKTITDNKAVLHHWILYAQSGGFLTGWAPGEDGVKMMGPDIGMEMPSGANSLRLDMHYNSLTQTANQNDNSGLEICVVKQAKFRKNTAAVTMGLSSLAISIPPNSKGTQIKSSYPYNGSTPVTLLSASPHAHTYARRMIFSVKKKNGTTIMMHDMPFMFGEQKSYPLNPPVVVEAGDTINTTCIYDNDTNKTITFGENTGNEMCFNFALYYPAGALGGILGGGIGGLLGGSGFFGGGTSP